MERSELKNKIAEIISNLQMASVATINDGKPWVRYMMLQGETDLSLYTATFSGSRKVEQIKKDNNVDVIIGGDPQDYKKPNINIQATAEVLTDIESKKKCWTVHLGEYFSGPEDPNYSVIKFSPKKIEYMSGDAMEPEVYTVD